MAIITTLSGFVFEDQLKWCPFPTRRNQPFWITCSTRTFQDSLRPKAIRLLATGSVVSHLWRQLTRTVSSAKGWVKTSLFGLPPTYLCPEAVGVSTAINLYLLCNLSICLRMGDFHSPDTGKKFKYNWTFRIWFWFNFLPECFVFCLCIQSGGAQEPGSSRPGLPSVLQEQYRIGCASSWAGEGSGNRLSVLA